MGDSLAPQLAPAEVVQRLLRTGRTRLGETPHNERVLYLETGIQAVMGSGAVAFLGVYLVRLGAPTWLVGLFTSVPALMMIVTALPIGAYVQGRTDLVRIANGGRFLYRISLVAFALLPFLPPTLASYLLVALYSLIAIPGSVGNMAFVTILGMVSSPERRPRMLSTRLAVHGLAAAVVSLVAGQWLNRAPYPINYQVLFLSGFVAGMVSIYVLTRLRLPDRPVTPGAPRRANLRATLALMRNAPLFRRYAVASFLFHLPLAMPNALYSLYRIRVVGASDAWIGVMLTAEAFLSVFSYFALGRIAHRPAVRRWLWLSCPATLFYPLVTSLITTPEMLVIPSLFSGIFSAAMNVYLTDMLFQVSPEESRPAFISGDVLVANLTAFIGPLLGTALGDIIGIRLALLAISGLRLLGGLSFWWLRVGQRPVIQEQEKAQARA